MLTRLRVQNFKNLRDVEVYFGPLTVIAGPNGVGKSNLLDAIQFLGNTAAMSLAQAALLVRGKHRPNWDIRKLFYNSDNGHPENIRFEAEFQIPESGEDAYGQKAIAGNTSLSYSLEISLTTDLLSSTPINLVSESLFGLLPDGGRTEYFSVLNSDSLRILNEELHRVFTIPIPDRFRNHTTLTRSDLPSHPTPVIAQLYLKSWMKYQFQLEQLMASSLNVDEPELAADGGRMAAALIHLAKKESAFVIQGNREDRANPVYRRVISRVQLLVPDLEELWIMIDESKANLYLRVEDRWGNVFFPASLSEGTLRLIALSVLAESDSGSSFLSIEEPENGFHPRQIHQVLSVLRNISDQRSDCPRQVLVSTHSPSLVACSPEDSLLLASQEPKAGIDLTPNSMRLSCLSGTWRASLDRQNVASKGHILSFLGVVPNPASLTEDDLEILRGPDGHAVFEREDFLEFKLQSAI